MRGAASLLPLLLTAGLAACAPRSEGAWPTLARRAVEERPLPTPAEAEPAAALPATREVPAATREAVRGALVPLGRRSAEQEAALARALARSGPPGSAGWAAAEVERTRLEMLRSETAALGRQLAGEDALAPALGGESAALAAEVVALEARQQAALDRAAVALAL